MVELMAAADFDCICLDAEHAPFDRTAIEIGILAARANNIHVLVRLPTLTHEHVLNALDCGADGVMAPHICNAADARRLVAYCHYGPNGRGYSGSTRDGGYSVRAVAEHRARDVAIVAQIEDRDAVDAIDEIACEDGLDALFLGPADLMISYGAEQVTDPGVAAAMEMVCVAARRHRRPIGIYAADHDQLSALCSKGFTLFMLGSDQSFALASGRAAVAAASSIRELQFHES